MSDPTARSLAVAAVLISVLALALALCSPRQPYTAAPLARERPRSSPPRPPPGISTPKQQSPSQAPTPAEVTLEGLPDRVQRLELELSTLHKTLANAEKAFYVTLDQTAPDVSEQTAEGETIHFASVPLWDLSPSIGEVLEVHYRFGNQWHVLGEDEWEVRDGTLLVRTGRVTGDKLFCKVVCR